MLAIPHDVSGRIRGEAESAEVPNRPANGADAPLFDAVDEISPKKQAAAVALAGGSSLVDAAALAGVHRVTVSRWLNHDGVFRAALDAVCVELRAAALARLRAAADDATFLVEAAVDRGDARLAMQLLRAMGYFAAARIDSDSPSTPSEWRADGDK